MLNEWDSYIGSIRDEFSQENVPIAIERVDDYIHQPRNLCLELEFLRTVAQRSSRHRFRFPKPKKKSLFVNRINGRQTTDPSKTRSHHTHLLTTSESVDNPSGTAPPTFSSTFGGSTSPSDSPFSSAFACSLRPKSKTTTRTKHSSDQIYEYHRHQNQTIKP